MKKDETLQKLLGYAEITFENRGILRFWLVYSVKMDINAAIKAAYTLGDYKDEKA